MIFGRYLKGTHRFACDVCIVGSGPGGAAAAATLTDRGLDVLLVEEGSVTTAQPALSPEEVLDRYYRSSGLQSTVWPVQIAIPTGKAFGGTSVINSGTCFPTPDGVLDRWAEDLGVHFDRARWRATEAEINRELSVKPCPEETMGISNRLFAEGLKRLGHDGGYPLPRCEVGCVGSGRCCFICPKDAKQAVQLNYLKTAMAGGMRALLETEVVGMRKKRYRVEALIAKTSSGARMIIEAKHVVLAMGSLATPHFLARQGLQRRYPAMGRNLSIHPALKLFALMPERVEAWHGVPQAYGYCDPEHPDVHFEGVFLPPSLAALNMPFLGAELADWMLHYDRMVGFGFLVVDSQYGRIYSLPGCAPLIRYGLTSRDLDNFYFGMCRGAEAYFAMGATKVVLPLLREKNVFTSWEELQQSFTRASLRQNEILGMAFHPLGSCRFAADRQRGVIDMHGRLHEHQNLYIADGSAIAGPLGVNPQVSIIAFAKQVARQISK